MASTTPWLPIIFKIIGRLVIGGCLLFVAACLFWWWAWTNTGEMNQARFKEQRGAIRLRPLAPGRARDRPITDTLAAPAR
ncbi:hypothetical protein [Hymenobacter convexus]|uniref:hypothetical protein n=1 Tax=Hymenobacter sp. CA1UV-4 TaxID=3063782 RepID=UPI0027139715|nr:hypothetical protein [Hymenobacter sp. CA1UV-4]MDO7852050.1 hypothetical protein [Hymenobacter sp. CA1UV-4]